MTIRRTARIHSPPIKTAVLFLCLLLVILAIPTEIGAVPTAPSIPDHSRARAVIVYNKDQSVTVLEKNADTVMFPASTVKIMTGLLVSELLSERMDETVTLSDDMLRGASGNSLKLESGEEIKIRDLYYAAFCGGYNDACTALAAIAAGTVDCFVTLMNERAAVLGMKSTVYTNPTGLHSATMVTTARDTLLLSLAAADDPLYMAASSAVRHEISQTNRNPARSFYNRNYLIASAVTTAYHNPYASGLNGGLTDEGGWCLATRVERFDLTWFCIILGGEEDPENGTIYSYKIANELLSWAARGYEIRTVVEEGDLFAQIPVKYASIADKAEEGIPLVAASSLSVFIPKNPPEDSKGLTYTVRLHESTLEAPIEAGKEAGVVIFTYDDEEVGRITLITKSEVRRNDFTFLLSSMRALPKNRIFIASLVSFLILTTVYFLRVTRFRRPRRRRSSAYVPTPFRNREDDRTNATNQTKNSESTRRPPIDPYASSAAMLDRHREHNKKKKE